MFFEIYKTIWLNFQKIAKFCKKSAIFAKISSFFAIIRKILKKFAKFCDFLQIFATFSKNHLDSFVDLEKPEKMRIWLQNFVSIQPRTSLEESGVSWPSKNMVAPAPWDALRRRHGQPLRCWLSVCWRRARSVYHDTSLSFRLVLGCIETKFCIQIRILQHFAKSTKLASWFFKIYANFTNFCKKLQNFPDFSKKSWFFAKIAHFLQNFAINLQDFENSAS